MILPLLVLLTFGIIEFGVAFNASSSVSQSSRAGGRTAAIFSTDPQLEFNAAQAAATALDVSPTSITGTPKICVAKYIAGADPCVNTGSNFSSGPVPVVHPGSPGAPVWTINVTGTPGQIPTTNDNWPVASRNFGCPTPEPAQRQLRPRRRARAGPARPAGARALQAVLRQQDVADDHLGLRLPTRAGADEHVPMKTLRARRSDERGVVLVWLAVTLVLLLGVAAFGIDVAYWQVTKNREQRAADAAALAGAVTFPGDLAASNTQAQGVAADNGYTVGSVGPLRPATARSARAGHGHLRGRRRPELPVQGHRHEEGQQLLRRHLRDPQHDGARDARRPSSSGRSRWAARRTSSATIPTRPTGRSTPRPAADVPELLGQHQRRRHREATR